MANVLSSVGKFFFGQKPKVPSLPSVDPLAEQQKATQGNIAALPGLEALAGQTNQFNLEELSKALEFMMPGALGQVQQNLMSGLKGELSPDVSKSLARNSVAKAFGQGVGGSFGTAGGIGPNEVLRNFGLTSMDVQNRATQNFLSLSQALRSAQFDYSRMFRTPTEQINFALKTSEDQFNAQWLRNQISAAPDPAGAWTAQLIMQLAGTAGKAIGAAI